MTPLADLSFTDAMLWVVAIIILGIIVIAALPAIGRALVLFAGLAILALPVWLISKLF